MKPIQTLPLLLLLTACGARPVARPASDKEVEMEPMIVEADESGRVEAFDAQALFETANAAFQAHDFDACDKHYDKLLTKFPQSRFVHSALYNRGLCLEHLGLHRMAATHFRRHAQLSTELLDVRDGEFRWGYNLVKAKDYPTAVSLYTRLLAAEDLGPADRAECHLRRAIAYAGLGKTGEAERELKHSMERVREAYGEFLRGNDLFAEAHFRRGEIYQGLSHTVHLKLPMKKMKDDLQDKIRFFKRAQASYLDALNVQHSYWATAAGLKLGELYEQFYDDVIRAEAPEEFDALTYKLYLVELRKLLRPVLEQSVMIYEKNISMSQRLGAENEWVKETEQRLKKLRALIEETENLADPTEAPQG